MKNIFYFTMVLSLTIISCGKSIDKNSFEGRVASVISDHEGANMALSMDLKNIIEKSGIKDGAIPSQYLETITPYLDALYASVNMDNKVFIIPILNYQEANQSSVICLFNVKDVERLKKELKEMGLNLSKKGNLEFANDGNTAAGIYKGETGFFIGSGSEKISDDYITGLEKSLGAGQTIDGVVDFVTTNTDMTMFFTGDKAPKQQPSGVKELDELTKSMAELSKGTYWIAKMEFKDQEAIMDFDITYGKNIKKYMPLFNKSLSKEGKSVVVDENTIGAYAFSMNFEKYMNLILDALDEKTKADLNKNLAMIGGLEKLKTMFTGEMSFAMSMNGDIPNITAFIGLGDKKHVQSLFDGFGALAGVKKSGDNYTMGDAHMQFTKEGLMFAMSKSNLDKMKSNKPAKLGKMDGFEFGKKPFSMFIDMKKLQKVELFEEYGKIFKDFEFVTMEMGNDNGKFVFKSSKKNQNVLRTLVESAIEMQRIEEEKRIQREKEYEEMWGEYEDENWDDEDYNF